MNHNAYLEQLMNKRATDKTCLIYIVRIPKTCYESCQLKPSIFKVNSFFIRLLYIKWEHKYSKLMLLIRRKTLQNN